MSAKFLALCFLATLVSAQGQVIIRGGGRIQINGNIQIGAGGIIQLNGRNATSLRTNQYQEELRNPTLTWQNGESIAGELHSADAQSLQWKAMSYEPAWRGEIFAEPLPLQHAALRRIDFPKAFIPPLTEPFAIALVNGDRLFADIIGTTDDGIVTSSRRHGPLTIALSAVSAITRLKDEQVVYSGPTALNGWRQIETDRSNVEPQFIMSPEGGFTIHRWNRTAFLPLELPEKWEIRLRLSASQRPMFAISFSKSNGSGPSVECWQDELVIAERSRFTPIRTIGKDERHIDLRITWDRSTKELTVCDWNGAPLGKFTARTSATSVPGVAIKNKSSDLTLAHLSVRKWDGARLLPLVVSESLVELADGSLVPGVLKTGDASTGDFRLEQKDGQSRTIPLAQLRSYLRKVQESPSTPATTRVEYNDGTLVSGDLLSITEKVATLKSPLSASPITTHLEAAARIRFQPAQPLADTTFTDRLVIGTQSLAGKLEGKGDATLFWRGPGTTKAVALLQDRGSFDIVREPTLKPMTAAEKEVFVLQGGVLLPGALQKVTEQGAELSSPYASVQKIANQDLLAVCFREPAAAAKPRDFSTPGWTVTKGPSTSASVADGTLTLRDAAAYAHPSLLNGDEIHFSFNTPENYGALALELFSDPSERGSRGASIHMMRSQNQFWCAVELAGGQSRTSDHVGNIRPGPVKLTLTLRDGMLEIKAHGIPLLNTLLPMERRRGQGIVFGPSEMWGGGQVSTLQISNFRVIARADHLPMPLVGDSTKLQTLELPRFRRDSPPRHAIIAPNGDVLRGTIESITADSLTFRAGTESLPLPLSRLQSAIWLQPPTPEEATPALANPAPQPQPRLQGFDPQPEVPVVAQAPALVPPPPLPNLEPGETLVVLQTGGRFPLKISRFDPEGLQGEHPVLGECKVSYDSIATLRNAQLPASTSMQAYLGWALRNAPEPVLPEGGGQSSPLLGKPAPPFTIQRLGSVPFDLASERGKVVVLDFWASWCGPCVSSMPDTIRTVGKFDRSQVSFLAINQGEPEPVVSGFLQKRAWELPVALDLQQKIGSLYRVEAIPFTVVIDRQGKVTWTHSGADNGEKLEAAIRKALVQ